MLRLVLIVSVSATVLLVIAAVFFCDDGEIGEIDAAAMKHYRLGKYAEALAVWEEGLGRFPASSTLNFRLGTTLAVRGHFEEAAEHLERAVAASGPEQHEIRRELALCYLQDERLDDAERELKTLLSEADWFPEAHYFLGHIYEKRNEPERAMKEYVRELNVNPSCTYAWAKVMASGDTVVNE